LSWRAWLTVQVADMPTCDLVSSQTGQLTDAMLLLALRAVVCHHKRAHTKINVIRPTQERKPIKGYQTIYFQKIHSIQQLIMVAAYYGRPIEYHYQSIDQ